MTDDKQKNLAALSRRELTELLRMVDEDITQSQVDAVCNSGVPINDDDTIALNAYVAFLISVA